MAETTQFAATTPTFAFPLLFQGQSQKEFFVNQSLCLLDTLIRHSVTESRSAPPASALEGQAYRIVGPGSGAWSGRADQLAMRIGGSWHFVAPTAGMALFDEAAAQWLVYRAGWSNIQLPATLTGGTVIDTQARELLTQLIDGLADLGILKRI